MTRPIRTHFLPALIEGDNLRGKTAVVIDVLRAGTTICHALAAGATAVVPCETVETARQKAAELSDESPLLGGERDGVRIDGFDLDNSPLAYTPEMVRGKTVVFTTTNGTRALMRCREAEQIILGTFNNLSAVVRFLQGQTGGIDLVCAGTRSRISAEDVLFAGMAISRLTEGEAAPQYDLSDDSSAIAADYFLLNSDELIRAILFESGGGRNVLAVGLEADIDRAAQVDRFDFVPVYSPQTEHITAEQSGRTRRR